MARVVVLGRSGTGKSYYTGHLLEQVVPEFTYAVHYDIENEETGLSEEGNELYGTVPIDKERAGTVSWKHAIHNHRKLRVVPGDLTTEELREIYAQICNAAMKLCNVLNPNATAFISCDEAHNIVPQEAFPQRVERMITGGRKHGVECLHISQRPQLLHTTVISQADKRVYFAVSDDNDLKKIDKQAGFSASRLNDLSARTCIEENKNTGQHTERDTDELVREHPHYSGDDGIVDDFFEE